MICLILHKNTFWQPFQLLKKISIQLLLPYLDCLFHYFLPCHHWCQRQCLVVLLHSKHLLQIILLTLVFLFFLVLLAVCCKLNFPLSEDETSFEDLELFRRVCISWASPVPFTCFRLGSSFVFRFISSSEFNNGRQLRMLSQVISPNN